MKAGWKTRMDERIYFEQKKKVREILLRERQRLEMEIHAHTMRRESARMENTLRAS
jgi:hypothetical protein